MDGNDLEREEVRFEDLLSFQGMLLMKWFHPSSTPQEAAGES